jgi:iron complex outermembrane receptor protein
MRIGLLMLLALAAGAAASQTPPASAASAPTQLDKVTVSSSPSASSRRRSSTASKIVIDRDELARYGDTQLGDVLRRLPGVTIGGRPGRGGDIRLRGMGGGFTQILIDGERAPAGFSVEQLPPDQVERIEILRAPTAETGARAVAGTINIILREPIAKSTHELRASVGGDHGEPQADFNWTRNAKWLDEVLVGALSLSGNLYRRHNDIDVRYRSLRLDSGEVSEGSSQTGNTFARGAGLNGNARLRWKLNDQQQLWISPVFFASNNRSDTRIAVRGNSRYDAATGESEGGSRMLRLNASWHYRPTPSSRWELRGGIGSTRFDNDNLRLETLGGAPVRRQDDHSETRDDNRSLGGKWSLQTDREHQWVSGWELETGERLQTRTTLENGLPKAGLEEFGDSLAARTRRLAAYTQDEWSPNPQWSVYAGLRWEQMQTQGDGGGVLPPSTTVSSVWSPLFHLLWKPAAYPKDQVRLSLTRSYRAPSLNDLIAKPVVNASYPNGANPQTHADSSGNPDLRPELATGLDVSVEHWLSSGGILSISAYMREIDGLIRRLLVQETVSWDAQKRWVSRPRNLDKARTFGIELEAKARLDELWADAPDSLAGLLLRANLALFKSEVDGIPGPDNRLEQQPRGTVNLGLDYLWANGLRSGFNWGYVPVTQVQQTPLLWRRDNQRRVLDAYLQWSSGDPRNGITWRLSFANLLPADTLVISQVDSGNTRSITEDRKRTFAVWNLRAETRF